MSAQVNGVQVPQPIEVLHGGGTALACDREGRVAAEQLHGLFAGDTRVLSTYRIGVGGHEWQLLSRTRPDSASAQWNFQNPAIQGSAYDLPAGTLLFSVTRRLAGALHDDLRLSAFVDRPVCLRLALHLDADFADIFEVKDRVIRSRLNVLRISEPSGLTLSYERRGFRRGLRIRFRPSGPPPVFVGTLAIFDLELAWGTDWTCCLEAAPIIGGEVVHFRGDPHAPGSPVALPGANALVINSDTLLQGPFERGRADLHSLAVEQPGRPPYPAAGAPWFLTLFGRDTLFTALMGSLDGSWLAEGALAALGERQAKGRDDWRDAEPGKLPHEVRRGELAYRGEIPHSAYYGTHDTPALYCLALWQAWRWTRKRSLLDDHLETARAALRWCDEAGDRDGDELQEYATRSSRGYYNQGWKDAGDAVVHDDGRIAEVPLATVELQGYLFAARLAMAELLDITGDGSQAERLRRAARDMRARVEERFWMEEHGFYALALDRDKRQVASVSSNPGHLLWCGLPGRARASRVAERLLRPDLFSGWGLRTLSTENPAYNPLSYQRGSVWPFDTALAAAGLFRYGLREEASTLLRSILEAATAFEKDSLPELFCGIDRARGLPVPYERANRPQAWSAAVPLLAAHLFLGLVPDAPHGRCYLSPWLPEWLPHLELRGIVLGSGKLDVRIIRRGGDTVIDELNASGINVVHGTVEAPLWGEPILSKHPPEGSAHA
jgi:glycogen debranching enzyme